MSERGTTQWGFFGAMRTGVKDLFSSRKAKAAMWGVVGLGVLITYMELVAVQLFSYLVTNVGGQTAQKTALLFTAFLLTFAAIKSISYFQSVYRLTVFEKAFRSISDGSRASEAWRWPMAIAMVGIIGQLARLAVVTLTVMVASWMFGLLLMLCSLITVLIVNRVGRKQYTIHHEFVEAKTAGNPPSAAKRIGTRIRAGEKAGLYSMLPILGYFAALGLGAANGSVTTQSSLLLFIAGRMANNMYGTLSNDVMRYIRAQVNVEAYSGSSPSAGGSTVGEVLAGVDVPAQMRSGSYLWEPPTQAFARLIDDGCYVGDPVTLGRVARDAGFGVNRSLRKYGRPSRQANTVAVGPNQVWLHGVYSMPTNDAAPLGYLQVVIDAFSRMIIHWRLVAERPSDDPVEFFQDACGLHQVLPDDVTLHRSTAAIGATPNLHDLLSLLGVGRTLLWSTSTTGNGPPKPERPAFPTGFKSLGTAEVWLAGFIPWHNEIFYQPDVGYLHPCDVHAGLADGIASMRQRTLETLLGAGDNTFPGGIPDAWLPPEEAWVEELAVRTRSKTVSDSLAQSLDEDEEM